MARDHGDDTNDEDDAYAELLRCQLPSYTTDSLLSPPHLWEYRINLSNLIITPPGAESIRNLPAGLNQACMLEQLVNWLTAQPTYVKMVKVSTAHQTRVYVGKPVVRPWNMKSRLSLTHHSVDQKKNWTAKNYAEIRTALEQSLKSWKMQLELCTDACLPRIRLRGII
ncbi:hypothetical protein ACEPPN_014199 [Leptodophora sp. 'Broadleaf-Isolate-01']